METLKFCFFVFVYLRKPLEKYFINLRIRYKTMISTYVYIYGYIWGIYIRMYLGLSSCSSSTIARPFSVANCSEKRFVFHVCCKTFQYLMAVSRLDTFVHRVHVVVLVVVEVEWGEGGFWACF